MVSNLSELRFCPNECYENVREMFRICPSCFPLLSEYSYGFVRNLPNNCSVSVRKQFLFRPYDVTELSGESYSFVENYFRYCLNIVTVLSEYDIL